MQLFTIIEHIGATIMYNTVMADDARAALAIHRIRNHWLKGTCRTDVVPGVAPEFILFMSSL